MDFRCFIQFASTFTVYIYHHFCFMLYHVTFLLGLLSPLHSICLIDLIIPCIDEVIFLCRQLTQFLLMLRISQFSYCEVISSLLFGSRVEICAGFVVVDSFRFNRFMFNV